MLPLVGDDTSQLFLSALFLSFLEIAECELSPLMSFFNEGLGAGVVKSITLLFFSAIGSAFRSMVPSTSDLMIAFVSFC